MLAAQPCRPPPTPIRDPARPDAPKPASATRPAPLTGPPTRPTFAERVRIHWLGWAQPATIRTFNRWLRVQRSGWPVAMPRSGGRDTARPRRAEQWATAGGPPSYDLVPHQGRATDVRPAAPPVGPPHGRASQNPERRCSGGSGCHRDHHERIIAVSVMLPHVGTGFDQANRIETLPPWSARRMLMPDAAYCACGGGSVVRLVHPGCREESRCGGERGDGPDGGGEAELVGEHSRQDAPRA